MDSHCSCEGTLIVPHDRTHYVSSDCTKILASTAVSTATLCHTFDFKLAPSFDKEVLVQIFVAAGNSILYLHRSMVLWAVSLCS